MKLAKVIHACESCLDVLQTLQEVIQDDYFQALLEKSSQAIKGYRQELLIYEPLSCYPKVYDVTDDVQEMRSLTHVCQQRLDTLLEAYLDILGYPGQLVLRDQLHRQFLEFSDIRDMVLHMLKTLPPWVVLEKDVILGPGSMSGSYAARA